MTPAHKIRQSELAKVHLAKKLLGLDDDTYRAMIERITDGRTDSAGEMTAAERHTFLDELTRKGFRPAPPRDRQDDWITISPNHPGAQHLKKLLALAYELERIGAVRANSTGRWLQKFVRKLTRCDRLQWLTPEDANKVIEALEGWRKKFEARHPIVQNQPTAPAAIPATAITKAAAFDVMQLIAEPGSPVGGIRNVLVLLSSRNLNPEIDAAVGELIHDFGARAHRALIRWDFKKVRSELLALMERVAEIEPAIEERMLAALKPDDDETTGGAPRGPQNRKSKGGD